MHKAMPIISRRILEKMREQRITVKANLEKLPAIYNERNGAAVSSLTRVLLLGAKSTSSSSESITGNC